LESSILSKPRHYLQHQGDLRERLKASLPEGLLHRLHRLSGWRHAGVAGLLMATYLGLAFVLASATAWWLWLPAACLQGFVILNFTILLHEVVHDLVVPGPRRSWAIWLGRLYALPCGISASQFDRWHNDHHRELGNPETDPKRAHLSPKRNARWWKLLYMTPLLFLIYARAAKGEAQGYEAELQRRIRLERLAALLVHAAAVWGLAEWGGAMLVLKVWFLPLFVFFPIAFVINRLGQHYDIDPNEVAAWSTRVDGNPLIRLLFLASNHHIEHHYFPRVPLYRLPELNRALGPFFAAEGIPNRSYRGLLYDWFVRNRAPHSDWRPETRTSHETTA
jgi:fatty acid desaturase